MNIILNEIWLSHILFKRHLLDNLLGIMALIIAFSGVFFGINFVAGDSANTERIDILIYNFISWIIVLTGFSNIANTIITETKMGTLENITISTQNPLYLFLVRAFIGTLSIIIIDIIIIYIISLIAKKSVPFEINLIIPMFLLTINAYGIGFAVAGLALISRAISQLLGILQFAFLLILSINTNIYGTYLFLVPFASSANILKAILSDEKVGFMNISLSTISSFLYLIIGIIIFNRMFTKTKKNALLGKY